VVSFTPRSNILKISLNYKSRDDTVTIL